MLCFFFFFFKQKTAYEMCGRDWSSDVCSSDLQGSIVEEFVCCRALAPQAPRTKRLHALIAEAMPVADLPQSRQNDVRLPWDGVQLDGICG